MPIATVTRAEPKTFPTTVGMVEKKAPFAMPLTMTNTASGAKVVEAGQRASMLNVVRRREVESVFSAPNESHSRPERIRPTAEAKLKPARRPAPVLVDSPMDRLYRGRKKGGTRSGNVPTAPAMKIKRKLMSLKSRLPVDVSFGVAVLMKSPYHSTKAPPRIGVRSLMSQAAGNPVASVSKPQMRYVHAGPNRCINASSANDVTVPPRPPPAKTIPFASPRFLLKYCAGMTEITWLPVSVAVPIGVY
jgi:hypothetical protein